MRIAVLNPGSRTIKSGLVEVSGAEVRVLEGAAVERSDPAGLEHDFRTVLAGLPRDRVDAVAHRVLHPGLHEPSEIDEPLRRLLEESTPRALREAAPAPEGIRIARELFPDVPAVAVFDTAFEAGQTLAAHLHAPPWHLTPLDASAGASFQGIAHASLVESLARAEGSSVDSIDAVTLQLGARCSTCAIATGQLAEISTGFTPFASVGSDSDSTPIADLRDVLQAEALGNDVAAIAVSRFVRRIVATVGAYLTLLGGRGSLVFGGGIGANSAEIRRRIAAGLRSWNVMLDPERNDAGDPGRISRIGLRRVYAFETREEPLIARAAAAVLGTRGASAPAPPLKPRKA